MLDQYKEQLEHTRKPAMRITLNSKAAEHPWNSKVGGVPYLPTGMAYPVDAEGEKLQFLAQINFEEMPALEGYPTQGILAFYVGTDISCGFDFNDPLNQAGFRVIYFEEIIQDMDRLQIREPSYVEDSPIKRESSILFEPIQQIITIEDGNCELNYTVYQDLLETYDIFKTNYNSRTHLLGGYPSFVQEDPRIYHEKIQDYVLLFQLDSDYDAEILWGDVGVANFFIHPNDLKNRDFSRVAYTWDCS